MGLNSSQRGGRVTCQVYHDPGFQAAGLSSPGRCPPWPLRIWRDVGPGRAAPTQSQRAVSPARAAWRVSSPHLNRQDVYTSSLRTCIVIAPVGGRHPIVRRPEQPEERPVADCRPKRAVTLEVFLWSSMASITLTSPPHGVEGASWSLWALVYLRRPAGWAEASWPTASGRVHLLNRWHLLLDRRHLLFNLWLRLAMRTMTRTPTGSSSRPRAYATGQAGSTSHTRPV